VTALGRRRAPVLGRNRSELHERARRTIPGRHSVLGNGHATAETLLDEGEPRDTHDPICRRLIAEALAWHLPITGSRR
jgi:hypothetical protein